MNARRLAAVVVAALAMAVAAVVALKSCGSASIVTNETTSAGAAPGLAAAAPRERSRRTRDAAVEPEAPHADETPAAAPAAPSAPMPTPSADGRTLVAVQPRTAVVFVTDAKTDRPIAGARVVSETEAARRRAVDLVETIPRAVTGADGRCELSGLSAGVHEIEIDADGHRQAKAQWSGADLRVRLAPHDGSAKVVVKVLGPDDAPVEGAEVSLVGTDRVAKSDAEGKVVFADTDPGFAMVSLDVFAPDDAPAAAKALNAAPRRTAETDTEDGGTYDLVLGFPPTGTAGLETRLVRDDGSPVVEVELTVSIGDDERTVKTDAAGVARFGRLPKGEFSAYATLDGTVRFSADDRAALRKADFSLCAVGMGVVGIFRPGTGDDDLVSTDVLPGRYEVDVSVGDRSRRFLVEVKSGATSIVEVKAP